MLQNFLDANGRELLCIALGLGSINGRSNAIFKSRGHTTRECRQDGINLGVRQFGVVEHFDELLECRRHDSLVVVTFQDIVECTYATQIPLIRFVAYNTRVAHGREKAVEWLGMFNSSGIVKRQNTKNVTWLETDTRLFDELHDTVLCSNERHIHFHDLNFSILFSGLDVVATVN